MQYQFVAIFLLSQLHLGYLMIFPVRGATAVNTDNVVMTRIHVAGT